MLVIEYAKQALQFNTRTLLFNSVCVGEDRAKGAYAYLKDGKIKKETLPGQESILIVEV